MTFQNFVAMMERLVQHFGEKGFPGEKLELLYEKCKHMTQDEVIELRKIIIGFCKINPTIKEISEVGYKVFAKARGRVSSQRDQVCKFCGGDGVIGEFLADCEYNGWNHYKGEIMVFACPECLTLEPHANFWNESKSFYFTRLEP